MPLHSRADHDSAARGTKQKPMPRISSMLFDLELEESSAMEREESREVPLPPAAQLHALLQPHTPAEADLVRAVATAYADAAAEGRELPVTRLAERLRRGGYGVRVRTALGGAGAGGSIDGECLRNLRHSFLSVSLPGEPGHGLEAIVDPVFAEQFAVAHPTERYAQVLDALPDAYVGTDITPVVQFLCAELAAAFEETGATLPPWRDAAAMLSKWQPRRSIDMDWDSDVPSPSAATNAPPAKAEISQDAAPKHVRRHSGGRAWPRGSAVGGAAAAAGLGTRSASQVTADTNSPRPSKAQRLGGAAAAAASRAALGLRGGGSARENQQQQRGRPPTSPAPPARLVPALTAPPAVAVADAACLQPPPLRDTQSEADVADLKAPLLVEGDWGGVIGSAADEASGPEEGGVRGMSPDVSSTQPAVVCMLLPVPASNTDVVLKRPSELSSNSNDSEQLAVHSRHGLGGRTSALSVTRQRRDSAASVEPAWVGSGSWRVSDTVPFPKATPAAAAAAAGHKALSDSGVAAGLSNGGGRNDSPPGYSASDASVSASLPAMRLSLDIEVSSPQPRADGNDTAPNTVPSLQRIAMLPKAQPRAAPRVPVVPRAARLAQATAETLEAGRTGDSFTFASAPSKTTTAAAPRTVSPFASATAPLPLQARPRPVVGELSHLFEGTARRGKPRGLSALSAPAVVSRPGVPGPDMSSTRATSGEGSSGAIGWWPTSAKRR